MSLSKSSGLPLRPNQFVAKKLDKPLPAVKAASSTSSSSSPPAAALLPPYGPDGNSSNNKNNNDDDDYEIPLEDFIPDPDGAEVEERVDESAPHYPLITAPPLNRVHFECFHGHRQMPTAENVWYAVPCMTCRKQDREIRHRCVFCCLRVCEACYQGLSKCEDRSLALFMRTLQ